MAKENKSERELEESRITDKRKKLVVMTVEGNRVIIVFAEEINCLLGFFIDTDQLQKNYKENYDEKTNSYTFTREQFEEFLFNKCNVPSLKDDDIIGSVQRLENAWNLVLERLSRALLEDCLNHQLLQEKNKQASKELQEKIKQRVTQIIGKTYTELAKVYHLDLRKKEREGKGGFYQDEDPM